MRVAIVGFGAEGKSSAEYWSKKGAEVTICDQNASTETSPFKSQVGKDYLNNLDKFDVVVRSPGVHPEDLLKTKITTTNTNEFFAACPTKNIVGVTGTKGKGTTSSLITAMLKATGKKVHLGGNIGLPPLELLKENIQPEDWVVLELSNFQLIDLKYSPKFAVCLLIEPEHQDWHSTLDEYVQAKQQLFIRQTKDDVAIYYSRNKTSEIVASAGAGKIIPYFSKPGACVEGSEITIEGKTICDVSDIKLLGEHNWQNICAAVTVVWQITNDINGIRKAISDFVGLPYRLEPRGEYEGVSFYNDSFSSQPEATIAAIQSITAPKVVILGGYDRQLDLTKLVAIIQSNQATIRKIILIGASAERIANAFKKSGFNNYLVETSKTMNDIVHTATSLAVSGDAILLSPGFPSFDMFKNFEDRGRKFNHAVAKLQCRYQKFVFKSYSLNQQEKLLTLKYGYDNSLSFTEQYKFNFSFVDNLDFKLLDAALQTLFFMAGVSYYKMYLAPEIVVEAGQLDRTSADFFSKTYQRGLGEFFYKNGIDPHTQVSFPVTNDTVPIVPSVSLEGKLVAVGGGKDSLVSIETLRDQDDVTTWSLGHKAQLTPLFERIGLPGLWVERRLDESISEHNNTGAYNGHIPISAIFASVGTVVAILSGKKDVVLSNESSASDPTLSYRGVDINHQYSKSLEFEQDFQKYLEHRVDLSVRYYSLLRPFSELRIAEIFSEYIDKYKDVFSSCNQSFTQNSDSLFWCGHCAKCAFTFLILTPFVAREKLEAIWNKNLLLEPALTDTYNQLLGIQGDKPLDCVGEIKESRAAMRLAQKIYPELSEYEFDIPEDYDWRRISRHSMPTEIYRILDTLTSSPDDVLK